jgi:2-keto-4-pentenoate hydratase
MSDQNSGGGRGPLSVKFPHEPARIRKGAELIAAMRRGEIEIQGEEGLPHDAYPRNIDEAQLMAEMVREILGWPVLGYKYYINARIQQAPMMTPIYHIWESPAVLSEEISQHRWIEPELGFRALRDFPMRDKPYSYEEIIEGVEAVPVFEIIGPRFRFDSHAHMRSMVNKRRDNPKYDGMADSHASGGYVVGEAIKDWKDMDWLNMRVTMDAGDDRMVDTIGGHPLVDPFISTIPLINSLRSKYGVFTGQLLASHSYSGFLSVPADVPIVSTFTGFKPIEAIFNSKPE